MSYTLTESGNVLTETQWLCLGMATEIEKLRRGEFICKRCGLRKGRKLLLDAANQTDRNAGDRMPDFLYSWLQSAPAAR